MILEHFDGIQDNFHLDSIRYITSIENLNDIRIITNLELDKFQIFPNPVIDAMTICYITHEINQVQIELFDALGKGVYDERYTSKAGMNQMTINLSKLIKGLYLCRLQNGVTVQTVKFLKN